MKQTIMENIVRFYIMNINIFCLIKIILKDN